MELLSDGGGRSYVCWVVRSCERGSLAVNYPSNRGTLISETFSLVGLTRILGFCENLCFSRILNCTRILQNPLEILEGKSSSFRSGFSRTRFFTICSKELGLIAECSGILSLEVIAGFALALRAVFRWRSCCMVLFRTFPVDGLLPELNLVMTSGTSAPETTTR